MFTGMKTRLMISPPELTHIGKMQFEESQRVHIVLDCVKAQGYAK